MQNEFEKQVREKMEELNLVPSAPVWDKIEMQISKKKDRRRLAFWIPLAIILISGGIWWLNENRETPGKEATLNHQKPFPASEQNNTANISGADMTGLESHAPSATIHSEKKQEIIIQEERNSNYNSQVVAVASRPEREQTPIAKTFSRDQISNKEENGDHTNTVKETGVEDLAKKSADPGKSDVAEMQLTEIYSRISGTASPDSSSSDSILMKDTLAEVLPAVVRLQEKKNQSGNKFQWGISFAGGIAGEGSGIRLKTINNFDVSAGSPPLTNVSEEGSATNNSLYFSAGIKLRKKLGEKFALVSGLGYDHYSSKRKMGTYISSPSVVSGGTTYTEVFLNYGQELNEVKSKYHFLSLPLLLEWKINKKIPLMLQGGFSFQRLMASEAWQFDKQTKVYFNDHSTLNKSHFFANLNLGYDLKIAGHSFMVGPSVQYGLNKLNETEGKRLFSLGFNAQFYLK